MLCGQQAFENRICSASIRICYYMHSPLMSSGFVVELHAETFDRKAHRAPKARRPPAGHGDRTDLVALMHPNFTSSKKLARHSVCKCGG